MKSVLTLRLAIGLVATAALGGCAYHGWGWPLHWPYSSTTPQWDAWPDWSGWRSWRVEYAGREPPVPTVEEILPSPGAGFVWVGGHWGWKDDDFEWVKGSWKKPPSGAHEWVPGVWGFDAYGWYYKKGHWQ